MSKRQWVQWVLFTLKNGKAVEVARGNLTWCMLRRAILRVMRPDAAILLMPDAQEGEASLSRMIKAVEKGGFDG